MNDFIDNNPTENEEFSIDFAKYWKLLTDNWKFIAKCTGVAFVIGCLIALSTPHRYEVVTKLAPELSSTATNRLSTMASMMGLSSAVLGTTDAVYPMVYPDLVHSPEFIADLFDERVEFTYKKEQMDTTLYAFMTEFQPSNIVGKIVGFPRFAIGWFLDLFKSKNVGESEGYVVDSFCFSQDEAMVYNALLRNIEADIDKKTLIVTIKVTMSDRYVSAQLARAVNQNIKKYVTKYRTEKAMQDCDYYELLYEEAKQNYYDAQQEYSAYLDSHQGLSSQTEMMEKERLNSETHLKLQLYTSTAQQLQGARAKVQQETPVFAEILSPTVPQHAADSRKKKALAFAFLGIIAGAAWIIWKEVKKGKNEQTV